MLAGVKSGPVSGELRLRNGAAEKRINGGWQTEPLRLRQLWDCDKLKSIVNR